MAKLVNIMAFDWKHDKSHKVGVSVLIRLECIKSLSKINNNS